ncbi:hypothetical protein CDV36_003491 [Fusarium kuroshium]|uniref:Uncharacterized protein n=1 Tax=Fusarium kuroshium TaxID=2010991 RepID=A0A3M2SH42_9HYPO|nr:hypothetical protein CDV36_003491 [Fusarium kuroshium]
MNATVRGDAVIEMESNKTGLLFENFEENSEDASDLHNRCSIWFRAHIKTRATQLKVDSTPRALSNLDDTELDQLMQLVKSALAPEENTSVQSILDTNDTLRSQLVAFQGSQEALMDGGACRVGDSGYTGPCQIVFILLGWLSKLYEPKVPPSKTAFEIVLPASSNRVSRFRKYETTSKSSVEVTEMPHRLTFEAMFGSFGLRLPQACSFTLDGSSSGAYSQTSTVTASNIFYTSLLGVGKLKIDWVPDMTHHLDLDERSRTLRIFAHPSYCALICLSSPESTEPLNKLLPVVPDNPIPRFDDYCREVLITLGVIFGQDKRSRKQALKHTKTIWRQAMEHDELLLALCTTRWHHHVLFNHLVAPPARANYSAKVDFPFFEEKLLRLQEYMLQQSPNDFRTLIWDRRDPLRFWTFVLAVTLAGVAILVAIIQTAIAAVALGLGID